MKCTLKIIIKTKQQINQKLQNDLKQLFGKFNLFNAIFENKQITIDCNLDGTATQSVEQLNKQLKQTLAENNIAVAEFLIEQYKLMFELEQEPLKQIKIPFADLVVKKNQAILQYDKLNLDFITNHNIERTIKLVQEKIQKQHYQGKEETHKIIYEATAPVIWDKDPTQEMLKEGWIKQGPTKGKWFYRPEFTAILRAMEQIIIQEILAPLGFAEVMGSNIIPEEIWLKTGHLTGMPMELYYVQEPATRNPDAWEGLIDEMKITKKVPHEKFGNALKKTKIYGLTYAQCPIIYWNFENKIFKENTLPIKIFDRTQNSFRYECGGRHGLERKDEFKRVEPVFIGTPEQLVQLKADLFERYKYVFNNILELEWRAAEVTPFFLQHAGETNKDLGKNIGTIDFEAWLPYRGEKEKTEWLEFQNLTLVGEKYAKAFNFKGQKTELWTGCTGIGLERWTITFLAQKGIDPKNWPKNFKEYLPNLPAGFQFC